MPFVFNEKDRHYNNIPDVPIARNWNDLPEDERKREFKRAEELGFVAPRKDGFFTEMGQAALGAAYGVGKGLGSTLEETTGYSGMKKYFGNVMLQNQHLNPYPGYKALSLNPTDIARTIGSGAAQSTLALGGAVVGGVLGGGIGGIAASTGMMFAQIYGDRVQEYREAYPNQDEGTVQGLAFLSSLGESLIESVIGPEQLATGIAKKWATGALKETTKGFAKTVGKEALKNFLTEGSEEVAQDFWDRVCRMGLEEQGIQLPSWEEVGETFMGGAWSGLALGGLGGAVEYMGSGKAAPGTPATTAAETAEEEAPYDPESERKTKLTLADQVAKELGIKVRYFDEAGTRGKDMDISDGWYDEKTGEIWLDRENPNADVMKNLGHEFKHFLDDKQKGLIQKFNELFNSGINEAGIARASEMEDQYQREVGQTGRGFDELSADTFGEFWTDKDFWQDVASRAEKMDAGMGQKFIEALQEFIKIVTAKLKKIGTPEAKQLFDNMNELREEAANILAEIKRQNGTSTEEENVVGVNGSTTVESVPVSEINLDPERFQFKSNTSKVTGVDESNKLGGEWDPKSAGIIYVWEDKDGNKFVVNGHHRLELAKRKNVKEMNAIVDREADNVTAEQARRNGVLINIRDEQGEIRDYADFVRSEKLDEETAEKEGVLSRRKGRAGFAIGHYASDNLYATYRNGDISDTAAATISDIARGDIGLENAGIKSAKSGMKKIQLVEHLKLLKSMDSLRQKSEDEQGDLFGGFDDSVLKMSEELSAKALDHIEELKEQINAAKAAVKNPEAAKKLGVSVGKEAQNLLDRTKRQLHDWENWQTNKKLFDQLLRETGNVMPEETPAHEESTSEAKQPAAEVEAAQPAPEQQPDFLDEHIVVSGAPITGTQVAESLAGQGAQVEQGAQAEAQQGGSSWGANNTIVSQDAYEKAKQQLRKAMGRMNVGIDPEILSNGAIVAAFHVEAGARKFAEFSAKMIEDLGDKIKPYLKALYESARRFPGAENIAKDMDSTDYVDKYDLDGNQWKEPQNEKAETKPSHEINNAEIDNELREEDISRNLRDVIYLEADASIKQSRLSRLAKTWNMSIKEVQERCEAEVVKIAREIDSREDWSDELKYGKMVELYKRQPNFSKRTSTSMINQAYSTPVPLAWILGKRIGLKGKLVYEPTAGTGMLTVAGQPATIHVNEINPLRSEILNRQGFMLNTSNDASKTRPNRKYERVIMNPPFDSTSPVSFNGFKLTKLDHVIAARALEAMAPDGRAAIIVGANTEGRDGTGRATFPDHVFMNYLYSNYNVKDNYIVSGSLYAKQGASYPVRVLTIDGKRTEQIEGNHPKDIEKLENWIKLYTKLKGELGDVNGNEAISAPGRSDNGTRNGTPADLHAGEAEQPAQNAQSDSGRDTGALDEGGRVSDGRREEDRGNSDEQRTGSTGSDRTGEVQGQLVSESHRPEHSGQRSDGTRSETVSGRNPDVAGQQGNDSGVRAEQPRTEESRGNGSGDVGRVPGTPVHPGDLKVGEKRGELNNTYNAASKSGKMDVVVPSFLAQETTESLQNLEKEVGNVDDFVRDELGYDSTDELYDCLSDAQVDSVAMAINSLKKGEGFIIGDQTGIGKGRQCAAIMRWAVKNGQIPIFFTKDPKLFSDMYAGDLPDIHTKLKPVVIGDGTKARIVDGDGNVLVRPTKDLAPAFDSLKKGKEFDSVFIPYSQINKRDNRQQLLLRDLIESKKCVLILDEAHEAAGADSNIGMFFSGPGGVLHSDVGVVYSSATFAKRPDTMALYAIRTKIKDAIGGNTNGLVDVLKRGGVALQQIISKGVASVGQYIRRERDFSGVSFDVKVDETNREDVEERYNRVAYVLGELVKHSHLIRHVVNEAEHDNYGTANTNEESRIQTSSFGSVCHNYINQLLLASKADIVIDNAERAFKDGQKPVIAVDNTMESALKNYCDDNNLKSGDPVSMRFSDILENALMRMYSFSRREGRRGHVERVEFTPEQYGLQDAHAKMLQEIHELDDIDLPISPIDYIKNELEKRGIRCGELTGRELGIDYSKSVPVLTARDAKTKDKNKNVNDFNAGNTDAIILNRSGSTGLSLHASQKFKDKRKRHMIMAQPSLDIAIVQQTFGRVLRSGQVVNPEYTILSSFLASERRVMMVLSRKLQSLNANTTANNKGSVNLGIDFLNKYGDDVAEEFLRENPDISMMLEVDADSDSGNEDLMKKLTGKMAILPNDQQEHIYDELIDRYKNKIDFLKKTGNYDLEITVHEDWDVITKSQEDLVEGDKNGTFFEQPVTMKKISVKEQRKIRDAKEVQSEIDENVGGTSEAVERNLEKHFRNIDKDIEELEKHYIGENRKPEYIRDRKHLLRDGVNYFKTFIRNNANQMLELQVGDDSYTGIITGYHTIGKYSPKSPFIPSAMIVDVAVADSAGKLSIPFSKFVGGGEVTYSASFLDLEDAFTGENRAVRTDMYAFTGNLLRAINLAERGKVVSYKTNDGKVENALLMPKNWNSEAMRDPRREFKTAQEILDAVGNNGYVATYDGSVFRSNGGYSIDLPRTRGGGKDARFVKDRGLIEITGDFESFGRSMRSNRLTKKQAQDALEYMMNNGTTFVRPRGDIHYHIPMKQRQQVNPILKPGEIRDEYQEQLAESMYEVRTKADLNKLAERRIAGFGGVKGLIQSLLDNEIKLGISDVSQKMMRVVMNSEEYKKLTPEQRGQISDIYRDNLGTEAGRALQARTLGAFDMNDLESIQAHVNAMLAKFKDIDIKKLRQEIIDVYGVDIIELTDEDIDDKDKLDEYLRVILSKRARLGDKLYEYWINAILSSPTTHAANMLGNTANTAYELGLKRLAEATVNVLTRRKDGATFGEFKQMMNAVNWGDARRRAMFAYKHETLTTGGKLDRANAAIGGKLGRAIRVPGRALRAADEFAKAIVQPMEATAYAYREAKARGYGEEKTKQHIFESLKEENSRANEYGRKRALDLTFQETPYPAVRQVIAWRESGGIMGTILKFFLPFIKTPSNILKQGIRKSPLGAANLVWQTAKGIAGKREFDPEYVSLVAEQILAWGLVAMLAGDGDDDDKPFITGSSPRYGSAEQKFKQNKLPPYSIRIGKNYYSYQRIEPLSTGLAFIADGLEAFRSAKRGEDGQKIISRLIAKTSRLVAEKSFLDSFGQIQKIIDDPEKGIERWGTSFAASWMPNAVRTTISAFDDNVRDKKNRERGENWFEDAFNLVIGSAGIPKASPKYDYFGRPVKKDSLADSGPLWQMMRLIPIKSVSPDDNMNRAERLMWKYNMTHPGEEYYPDVPAYYFQRDGQKLYTTGKYWDEFAQKSGQLALKQINNAFKHGLLNERKPTEKDIELIKKIFSRARKEVRDEMYQRKHYQK